MLCQTEIDSFGLALLQQPGYSHAFSITNPVWRFGRDTILQYLGHNE
jgi:hypothetical protein